MYIDPLIISVGTLVAIIACVMILETRDNHIYDGAEAVDKLHLKKRPFMNLLWWKWKGRILVKVIITVDLFHYSAFLTEPFVTPY